MSSGKSNTPVSLPAGASFEYLPDHLRYGCKEPLEVCPYNQNHRVKSSRLRGHIIKCAEKYPPLAICHYNATHRMPEDQMERHIKTCPSRINFGPASQPTEEIKKKPKSLNMIPKPSFNPNANLNLQDDDWD